MKHSEEQKFKFKPEINLTSEVICATDPSRCTAQSEADKVDRLYNADLTKKQLRKEQIQKELADQCTF